MIPVYLLQELVTFADKRTLAATADTLHVTQPSITRGMQKLETLLDVQLFERQPNKIWLTKTGEYAAQQAKQLLDLQADLQVKVKNFDHQQRQLMIGMTIPGPRKLLQSYSSWLNAEIDSQLLDNKNVVSTLKDHVDSVVFTNFKVLDPAVTAVFIGHENLSVNIDQFTFQANQKTITFQELRGRTFIVYSDIGPWRDLIQREIPDAKFMYQSSDALSELIAHSHYPYFTTNLPTRINGLKEAPRNRVRIPISDSQASMSIYANYLKTTQLPANLIATLKRDWPQN
ncbi:LysR family transcriptional regulator [Secundilactobacillus folii]|uniref:LysR family transcriptional regulator n=1 Tax=Secundilactobacillus folii TaxID=2678357 RepID=A0A7X2XV28_9LACO|nr:LysR family transcriptional regulator [Secundilactobacillus folii]MTV82149.1 LysR family transcriptional regulator [Secundilactobacillus folii]